MRETINGADLRRMIISAAAAIEINKQALNELNVFPVPDGDTGTNMSMTINSAASDLRKTEDPDLEKASKVAASALLRGARGNSGVILSLLFRGISKRLKGSEECDGVLWAQALQEGVDAAYKAVMKPAEGTILTVARLSAAKAADAARENNFIEFVHEAAIEEAVKALADTVNQNPVLKKAGVVDAGGKGWVVALEAMLSALQGEDVVLPEDGGVTETKQSADFSDFNTEDITFSYCTEFIISRENDRDPENLRAFLSELGDSLVLVDDDEIIKVHVHTNDPGKALTEALNYGSFVTVKIENMRLQHPDVLAGAEQLTAVQRQIVALMDVIAVEVGIPGGVGDLHGVHGVQRLGQGSGVFLDASLGGKAQHGGNALGNGLGGNDHHGLGGQGVHLLGGHDDVLIVGQDKDGLGGNLVHRLQDVLGAGVHGLAAGDDLINAQILEHVRKTRAGADGDDAQRLLRLGDLRGDLLLGEHLFRVL